MKHLKLLLLFFVIQVQAQQGGMWIPSLLQGMNEQEMQALGSKLSAKDIYDINSSSLKELNCFNDAKFSNLYIFATQCRRP